MRRPLFVVLIIVLAACGNDKKGEPTPTHTPAAQVVAATPTIPITYKTISPQTAYDQMSGIDGELFVDVRTPEEWASGHAEGATLIPLQEFPSRAPNELPDKEAEIFLICRSGNRSTQAAQMLIDMGYTHVYSIEGGTTAWQGASLPIVVP